MASISSANDSAGYLEDITVVLVGCTGSGKSATGNSILRRQVFESDSWFGRVTTTCKRRATMLPGDRILHVIDTPGLFDSSSRPQEVEKEIARCMDMAKEGIHAILMVVSLRGRFTDEQVSVVETLKHLFGTRILDYMIVVFTGGDDLRKNETLDSRLARACPKPLKELLEKCGNRRVVFNNITEEEDKLSQQREELLKLINTTVVKNGGKPYTSDLFAQLKKKTEEMDSRKDSWNPRRQMQNAYAEEKMYHRIGEMIQEKLREKDQETIKKLKQDMEKVKKEAREHVREQAEAKIEIRKLRTQLVKAQREAEERWRCEIL